MSKKQKIEIHRDADLLAIDEELDRALERLDGANETIKVLLESVEQTAASQSSAFAEIDDSGQGQPDGETAGSQPPQEAGEGESR